MKKEKTNKEKKITEKEAKEIVHRFKNNTYQLALKFLVIFGLIAVVGAFAGHYIDEKFDIKPYGSFGILFVSYVVTWTYIFKVYKDFKKVSGKSSEQDKK